MLVCTPSDLPRFYALLKELRPHLGWEDFQTHYQAAHTADGYQLVGLELGGELAALMGYRVLHDFVHGRHLYIDDLVTNLKFRSQGLGARLLKQAEVLARELGCSNVRLCTGIDNERGKAFYEREGWQLRAVVYKRKF